MVSLEETYPHLLEFISYIKFEKRYSRNTISSYETDLLQFFSYLISQYDAPSLNQITTAIIRSWLAELKQDDQLAKTINRKISTLRSFFKFALRKEWMMQTPMSSISGPKIKKRLPQFVEQKDIEHLLENVYFSNDFNGNTEKLIITLFYHTGLRVSELTSLKLKNFDFSNGHLKIHGKGNKDRIVPLLPMFQKQISEYIRDWRKENLQTDYVFFNEKGKPFNPRKVYEIVKRNLSQVTTIQKKSPHILRHSFATHLSNNGADINAIKDLLGHSSLASTQVYIHNNIEKLKEAYKKAHPKA